MKSRASLKMAARESLDGKILTIFALFLLAGIVLGIVTTITLGLGGILFTGGLMLSAAFIFLGVVRKKQTPQMDDLMVGYRGDNFLRGLEGAIRMYVFTFLWSLLFVIPGIIQGIAYSQMFYLMADEKQKGIGAGAAQRKSIAIMQGHKMDYFVLQLSFLPWMLLVPLTFGLIMIYLAPYMQATNALFYEELEK